MCIENESTGKYTCSHAPYTRFTSVLLAVAEGRMLFDIDWFVLFFELHDTNLKVRAILYEVGHGKSLQLHEQIK